MRRLPKIWRMTPRDFFKNLWLKWRFYAIRKFMSRKLRSHSITNKPGWELTFNDDFDKISWMGGHPEQKWTVGEHWGPVHPDKPNVWYGPPTEIIGSSAKFEIIYDPKEFNVGGRLLEVPFKVSCLSTANTFRQQWGRFECRMTLPSGIATWPAFWLWGPTWPPEFDIIEAYGGKNGKGVVWQEINMHWGDSGKVRKHMRPWHIKIDSSKNIGHRYHEFAMEWSPKAITFWTNGIKVLEFTDKAVLDKWYNIPGTAPWMIINHSLRNDGNTGKTKWLPQEKEPFYNSHFMVDYIRAYKKT